MLAVASSIGIWLYDTETSEELALLTTDTNDILSISFSPDGTILASAAGDTTVRLWDVGTGTLKSELKGPWLWGSVTSISFSPDGTTLAGGNSEIFSAVYLWDVGTGTLKSELKGPWGGVTSISFSPDGTTLASSWDLDNKVRLWDVETGTLKSELTTGHSGINSMLFSPDGTILASAGAGSDTTVRLWDVKTGTLKSELTEHTIGAISRYRSVPMVQRLPAAALTTGRCCYGMLRPAPSKLRSPSELRSAGYLEGVTNVSFSPDGTTLASGSFDGTVRLLNVATGTLKAEFIGHAPLDNISFSPEGHDACQWEFGRHGSFMGCCDRHPQNYDQRASARGQMYIVQSGWNHHPCQWEFKWTAPDGYGAFMGCCH